MRYVVAFGIAVALSVAGEASADTTAAQAACAGKATGERCPGEGGRSGTCKATTCTRFEHWKSPATTASYDCVLCVTEADAGTSARSARDAAKSGCATASGSAGFEPLVVVLSVLARRGRGGAR